MSLGDDARQICALGHLLEILDQGVGEVIPGNLSLPRWVRGCEWPPRRASNDRSRSNFSISQSTSAALLMQRTLANSGLLEPPFRVSATKMSALSGTPFCFCVFVPAPLMPEVAFVELPPQKDDLSRSTVRPPHSTAWFAADIPARPPPTTITC